MTTKKEDAANTTFLGTDALFKGSLAFEGTVCIEGKFEGRVDTNGTLIISETGDILADIEAGTVVCKGTITGNVTASQKVEMHPSSKIIGNVTSPSLSIEVAAEKRSKLSN